MIDNIKNYIKGFKLNAISLLIIAGCLLLAGFFALLIIGGREKSGRSNSSSSFDANEFYAHLKFELDTTDPLIDLRFLDSAHLYGLTFNKEDAFSVYFLDLNTGEALQQFSVFINEGEDYCNLTKLNNGGYAFTTSSRVVWANEKLEPQNEFLFPSSAKGIYDCSLSPSGANICYVTAKGLYVNSLDFDRETLLVPSNDGNSTYTFSDPEWLNKGSTITYRYKTEESMDSVGFANIDGSGRQIYKASFAYDFVCISSENCIFFSNSSAMLIPHGHTEEKQDFRLNFSDVMSVTADSDGKRLIISSGDGKDKPVKFSFLDFKSGLVDLAFAVSLKLPAPTEPVALYSNGNFAAQVEADLNNKTRVFIYY
ncbi:MAG: hypothetical protein LBS74_01135 [Oscillospiraceae bacterium]|jgi:hypothetical protein|nr:hypothetical protein [Oscillospiraceae bacterium]